MTAQKKELLRLIKEGRCEVLGLGISNMPLCRFLASYGAKIYGRDKKSEQMLGCNATELKALGVTLVTGDGYLDNIGGDEPQNTIIFRSPGIRPDVPQIKHAVEGGALLSSEMELFLELTPATVIGVTGSDGKTTTTTLIGEMLRLQFAKDRSMQKLFIGGNIGEPLLPRVAEMHNDDFAVLELSSFQLMTMTRTPDRSVITNITKNHLNWHTGMDEYTAAKTNIYKHAPCGQLTLNAENAATAEMGAQTDIPVTYFSSKRKSYDEIVPNGEKHRCAIFERDGVIMFSDGIKEEKVLETKHIRLLGRYNVENYMAAISATWGLVSNEVIREIAETFNGVEHRSEFVRMVRGVKYYNSSIDSTPTRTEAALSVFGQRVVVICGGCDKHIPFNTLASTLCASAKTVVLTGETANAIKKAITDCPEYSPLLFNIIEKHDFTEAVLSAAAAAVPGDIVILSPACASFDAFRNFEERGRKFKEIIKGLEN